MKTSSRTHRCATSITIALAPALGILAGTTASGADAAAVDTVALPPPTSSYTCGPVSASAPKPPPLPPWAMQDRQAVGLTAAAPLCPAGEVAMPLGFTGHEVRLNITSANWHPDVTAAATAATPPYKVQTNGTVCPAYALRKWYCHDIEDETGISDIGLYASMAQYKPSVESGDNGHSISQLWALHGPSTLETGWTVDPGLYKGNAAPHLFEYHTGDNYGADSCYNACGFVGATGSPVTLGETLPTNGSQNVFGVLLSGGDWWFYYGGYYYGYIPEYDASWEGNPITRITEAQVGGEVASTAGACTSTQMGDGTFGSAGGALINWAELIPPSGSYFPETSLVPQNYYEEGTSYYNVGHLSPSQGEFDYGGPGC